MTLTQVLATDIVGQTVSITFNNPSQVDQVSFASNQITMAICSTFNLSKIDLLLYGQYLTQFNNSLLFNFPALISTINNIYPVSTFQINITNAGVTHLYYVQTSTSNTVYNINYVPIATAASFVARASPVTISYQEFYMCIYMFNQYMAQIRLN